MKQSGFTPISILIAILILTLLGVGVFYVTNQQNQKVKKLLLENIPSSPAPTAKSNESTASAETANWITYTNTKFGFSFKYPNNGNWKFVALPNPFTNQQVTFAADCVSGSQGEKGCGEKDNITSFLVSLSNFKSINEYLKEASTAKTETASIADYQIIKLNGIDAVRAVNPGICNPGADACQNSSIEYYVIYRDQGYTINESFKNITHETKLNNFPEPIPNILSTFKFTQ